MKVEEYLLADGSSPYQKWFNKLDPSAAAKVTIAKVRMELGLISAIKWFDGIGEYKIDWGPGYRIYLAQDGKELIILFGGGTKKKQNSDIKEAIRLHDEYKMRKSAKMKIDKGKSKLDKRKEEKGKR
ncbi:type II toxin-antitoxin system RelE/ParE family toxin [soil metagenome]